MEEEVEKLLASEEMDDSKEADPSRQNRTEAHMNSQGWWQMLRSKPDGFLTLKGEVDTNSYA